MVNVKPMTMFTGDNLPILRGMDSDMVDLIYLDPPFNAKKTFSAPIGSNAAGAFFKDAWTLSDVDVADLGLLAERRPELARLIHAIGDVNCKGDKSYLLMMAVRLIELYRILKKTGALFLHCDSTMSHSLKLMLDSIFVASGGIRTELIWKRTSPRAGGFQHLPKTWGANTDTILFYCKDKYTSVSPYRKLTALEIINKFNKVDTNGKRYYDDSAHIWNSPGMGERPN